MCLIKELRIRLGHRKTQEALQWFHMVASYLIKYSLTYHTTLLAHHSGYLVVER